MIDSIQGMRIVFDAVRSAKDNNNPLSEEDIQMLLEKLVPDENVRARYDTFTKGYSAEELFRRIYSLLPWIKVIIPLGQEQYPSSSKSTLQVPDFKVIYETGDSEHTENLLVEVKLASGDKQTLRLPKYKYFVLYNYEQQAKIPLVFAIFWQKYAVWTLNSINTFQIKNSQYKITYEQACRNDLSAILGDYTYVFQKRPYRKTDYSNKSNNSNGIIYFHEHEIYGKPTYEGVSLDGVTYIELSALEPAVLDSAFTFNTVSEQHLTNGGVELIERLDEKVYVYKLSSLILGYLSKIYLYHNDTMEYNNHSIIELTFNVVDGLRQKCGGERYYLVPYERNKTSDYLIGLQFGSTQIYNLYTYGERVHNSILLAKH